MRMIALSLGVAASAIAAPAAAHDGLYFGADVGAVFANEYDSEVNGREDGVITESEKGWEGAALLGYDFGPIRTELEGSYKEFYAEQFSSPLLGLPRGAGVAVPGVTSGFGEHRLTSVMLNALVDLGGEGDNIGFSIGAGAGHTWAGFDLATTAAPKAVYLDDEAHDWAWQALAQLRVPVNENVDIGLKYKYFNTSEMTVTDTLGRRTELDLTSHSALVSFIYNFGSHAPPPPPVVVAPVTPPPRPAPPPVAPPPPPRVAPCNTGPYIVFFDWDRADITAEAATVLNSAVTAYGDCGTAAIMLAGHADRSGTPTYNVGLSQRRNAAVTAYLTGRGIPAARIGGEAFGETRNRVATSDGVRELQNRRVEVSYGPGSGR